MNKTISIQELNDIKKDIEEFMQTIKKRSNLINYHQIDNDFFCFLSKHIIFFKYLYNNNNDNYFYKVIISDLYYLILSIIENNERYLYLNERSIIENYTRAIMQTEVETNYVTDNLFDKMFISLKNEPLINFNKDDFSKIKSAYRISCNYIHGGKFLNNSLAYILTECNNIHISLNERKKIYSQITSVLKIYDKILIYREASQINGCFHRRKSIFKYLLGEKFLNLLFELPEKNL